MVTEFGADLGGIARNVHMEVVQFCIPASKVLEGPPVAPHQRRRVNPQEIAKHQAFFDEALHLRAFSLGNPDLGVQVAHSLNSL